MTVEKAKAKICPYLSTNCICDKCMFWVTTSNGKKEVDRQTEPYDMTPMDIWDWTKIKEYPLKYIEQILKIIPSRQKYQLVILRSEKVFKIFYLT